MKKQTPKQTPATIADSSLTLSQFLFFLACTPLLYLLLCLMMRVAGAEWPDGLF